jgi:transcriptional regulator with PAS, ATPase and Fis domain
VGELSPSLQAKLLRVLEDGHYRRVGGTQELLANVRVIAASNRSLEEEQRLGRFREDLYYRLNVIALYLPPLRERLQDLPELVQHFLTTRAVGPARCRMQPEALQALIRYDWPGNIRELANVLERAQILAEDQVITIDHLPENLVEIVPGCVPATSRPLLLREVERLHVQEVLRQEKGNKAQAAKALGISRRALYRLIAKYHLDQKP